MIVKRSGINRTRKSSTKDRAVLVRRTEYKKSGRFDFTMGGVTLEGGFTSTSLAGTIKDGR